MALTNYRMGSISASGGGGGGSRAYGTVPAPIAVPQNVYSQLQAIPGMSGLGTAATGNIMNELQGQLSPQTIRDIQDEAARFGVTSGMPGSQFAGYRGLRNLGINAENYRRQGVQDYNSLTSSLAPLQTNPELAANIADRNSVYAAAPDPQAAAEQQMANFEKELKDITSGRLGGGMGGSAGRWNPGPTPLAPAPSPGGGTGSFSTTHSNPFDWTQSGGAGPVGGGGGGGSYVGPSDSQWSDAMLGTGTSPAGLPSYVPSWSSNVMGGGAPSGRNVSGFYAGPQSGEGDYPWVWDKAAQAYLNAFTNEYAPETGGG